MNGPYVASIYIGHDASLTIVGPDRLVHLELERFSRVRHAGGTVDHLYATALELLGIRDDDVVAVVGVSGSMGQGPNTWRDYNDVPSLGPNPCIGTAFAAGKPLFIVPHHTAHLAYAFYSSPHERARLVAQDGGGDGYTPEFLPHRSVDCVLGVGNHPFGTASETGLRAEWVPENLIGGAWKCAAEELFGEYQEGKVMALIGATPEQTGQSPYTHERVRRLQDWTTRTFRRLVPVFPRGEAGPVCLAGGSALNGIAVYNLLRQPDVAAIHVPPSVHDGGVPVGAAMLVLHRFFGVPRHRYSRDDIAFCGYSEPALEGAPPIDQIADALAAGKVVGIAYGRAESGPRALGHRSLLADPRTLASKDKLNRIKGREPWRPTAPAVLRSHAETYFDLVNDGCYHFMTTIAQAHPGAAESIPAALHSDGSARVQVVERDAVPLGEILTAFYERTGCPVLLNTSLNGRGEPICNTASDAEAFFHAAPEIDAMAIGERWMER